MRRAFLFGLLIAHTTFVSAAALGAEPTPAERALQLSDEAVAFYNARDYRHAIEKYAAAYTLDPDPNLLFNQGRCYEALGDLPAANERYREFLSKPNGDVAARKKASDFMARFAAGEAGGQKAPPAAAPGPSAKPAESGEGGSAMRPIGLGLAGAGVVAVGVGAYFLISGRSDMQDIKSGAYGQAASDPNAVSTYSEIEANRKIDDAKSRQTLGGIVMGAGAGVALLGAGLYLFAPSKRSTPPATAFGGFALPGGGALTLQGRF